MFAEILYAGRAAIDMKRIKGDFSLNAWVRSPRVNLRGWTKAKINVFFFWIWSCYKSNKS